MASGAGCAPLVKSPDSSLRPPPSSSAHALGAEAVELVDGAQHDEAAPGVLRAAEADRLHHAVENLAVVDLHAIVAARDAELLQRVGRHHAQFGVGGGAGRADRVGVELQELAEAARTRLLVAEHVPPR